MADPVDSVILNDIKALLGLLPDYSPFDVELVLHINSVISQLNQMGVGPREGLVIDKDTKWSALLEGKLTLENVKSYIFMKVKMLYDPGSMTQHVIASFQRMVEEQEWRIVQQASPGLPQVPIGEVLDV